MKQVDFLANFEILCLLSIVCVVQFVPYEIEQRIFREIVYL